MIQRVQGIVRGRTIELIEELGMPDGERVEIIVQPIQQVAQRPAWGEGLRQCAGALAGIPGLDEDMEKILQQRKASAFREIEP